MVATPNDLAYFAAGELVAGAGPASTGFDYFAATELFTIIVPPPSTLANAITATAVGVANSPKEAVSTVAGVATAVGVANNPTVSTVPQTFANASTATATATANSPTLAAAPSPSTATATGAAYNASIPTDVAATTATSVAQARTPKTRVAPAPPTATATGQAYNATVAFTPVTEAAAITATAVAAAYGAAQSSSAHPATATAVGVANGPPPSARVYPATATATATAYGPTGNAVVLPGSVAHGPVVVGGPTITAAGAPPPAPGDPLRPRITVSAYTPSGTLVAALPATWGRTWQDLANDTGSASLNIQNTDASYAALNYGQTLRWSIDGLARYASIIETIDRATIAPGEDADQFSRVGGRGTLAVLEQANVYASAGIDVARGADTRTFNFASTELDATAWPKAVSAGGSFMAAEGFPLWPLTATYYRPGAGSIWEPTLVAGGAVTSVQYAANHGLPPPTSFLGRHRIRGAEDETHNQDDASQATGWIIASTVSVIGATQYLRRTISLAGGVYALYNAGNADTVVWVDGQSVSTTTTDGTGYRGASSKTFLKLAGGPHVFGVSVQTKGVGPYGMKLLLAKVNVTDGHMENVELVSDLDWSGSIVAHGFTAGAILGILITEAKARGCFPSLSLSFNDVTDSNGAAWPIWPEFSVTVGQDLLTVARAMVGAGMLDVWMDAGSLRLNAAAVRGSLTATTFTPAVNLRDLHHSGTI